MIRRPGFLAGSVVLKNATQLDPYVRRPRTLREPLWRPASFMKVAIAPRFIPDFDAMQDIDEDTQGVKVQLGQKTLDQLFSVQVPDQTDISWLSAKKRRLANGESETDIQRDPPFGRDQRQTTRKVSLGQMGKDISTQLKTVQRAVAQSSGTNMTALLPVLASIVTNAKTTPGELNEVSDVAQRLDIPSDWQGAGLPRRLYSSRQFKALQGEIFLFFLAHPRQGFNSSNQFVAIIDSNLEMDGYATIRNIQAKLKGKFLDVENRAIITTDLAQNLAYNDGVDGGNLDLTK